MICKDLFKYSNVVFVRKVKGGEEQIKNYAESNGIKIKITVGLFVSGLETEQIFKIELLERIDGHCKKTDKKIQIYQKLLNEGKSQTEIAKILGITREAVHAFIKYHNIKNISKN